MSRTAWTQRFSERMQGADMAAELFLPIGNTDWKDGRWRVRTGERAETRTDITGVRLLPADPARENLAPERQVQGDLVNLIATLRKVRALEGGGGLVLSKQVLRANQGGTARVRFGLDAAAADDAAASQTSYRRIRSAIRRSRLVVEHPCTFDPATGLAGLEQWGSEVRLRRRRRPWWLLLLPLLLLLFLLDDSAPAEEPEEFFGVPIETTSLVILLDKSSSMAAHFESVRTEARRVLQRMIDAGDGYHCNIIAYDARAVPAFDEIAPVDAESATRLRGFLDRLRAGGGTNLRSGLEAAAVQVKKHGQPTTLLILTDAQDGSIRQMLGDNPGVLDKFDGVRIVGNALTPRLFGTSADADPQNRYEQDLADLAKAFNGRFGPQ